MSFLRQMQQICVLRYEYVFGSKGQATHPPLHKPLNHHLLIPPHSSHFPGVFKGLIFGHTQRIFMLCSPKRHPNWSWFVSWTPAQQRLQYNPSFLEPCFSKAIHNVITYRDNFFKSSTPVNKVWDLMILKQSKMFSFTCTPFRLK